MVLNKSLDENKLIAALLHDVFRRHEAAFNCSSQKNTLNKVSSRLVSEGVGFLTKSLPRLGKAFDKALSLTQPLIATSIGFEPAEGAVYPKFLGELFKLVLTPDGGPLPEPSVHAIRDIRQVCYLFYKYELPYTAEQEQQVISQFVKTEEDLTTIDKHLYELQTQVSTISNVHSRVYPGKSLQVVRLARWLLSSLFAYFDPTDIVPRHGPGAVATKQQLWEKYQWTNVSRSITTHYPLDEYFYASLGHVCDELSSLEAITEESLPARVCLVPKDSRGPRLISCEPVDFQWVQQGLGKAIVDHVEDNLLTRFNVFFTDQGPNQRGALLGSSTGRYATLDLKEASDRVSLALVRLLFPAHIVGYLEACRSSATLLPDGQILPLQKFAPMGSCLCFPIMALTIWAILTAAAADRDYRPGKRQNATQEGILVYGDDVIVPTAFAVDAIEQLQYFGLKVNQDKSCISGLFRESCGVDAYLGQDVTPVRLRTVWSSSRSPDSFSSWVSYANSFWKRGYYVAYDYVVGVLDTLYGPIPTKDMNLSCPSLDGYSLSTEKIKSRINHDLQKREWRVWDLTSRRLSHCLGGWSMLLRYFTEGHRPPASFGSNSRGLDGDAQARRLSFESMMPFSVRSYTHRRSSMLKRMWR